MPYPTVEVLQAWQPVNVHETQWSHPQTSESDKSGLSGRHCTLGTTICHRRVLRGELATERRSSIAVTRRLIEAHGFTIVAAEADWPEAAAIEGHVRHLRDATRARAWRAGAPDMYPFGV